MEFIGKLTVLAVVVLLLTVAAASWMDVDIDSFVDNAQDHVTVGPDGETVIIDADSLRDDKNDRGLLPNLLRDRSIYILVVEEE